MALGAPQQDEGSIETPRNTILVATLNGKPDPNVKDVLQRWNPGLDIRWISSYAIPQEPPDDVCTLVLNAGDSPGKEAYHSKNVSIMRLVWNRDGSWAGWSNNV